MLRIGFDGRTLTSPAAGVRRYAAELFRALATCEAGLTIVAVGARDGTPLPASIERGPDSAALPTNAGWMLTGLPRAARRARLDLFHAPAYTVPLPSPRPLVVTIHDVSYERHPEWYPYKRDPIRRAFYRWSARAADCVITDSMFSKAEIVAAYDIEPDSIHVVPLAAASVFAEGAVMPLPASVPRRYFLHVGDLHVRRNLDMVARALAHARRRAPELGDIGLVLAGAARDEAAALDLDEGTRRLLTFTGHAGEQLLLALYRSAAALVYPSRYEGFGLPLLEAMACGVPVIASRTSSIPEVVADAAVLLDPDDLEGWSAALERVAADQDHAAALRQAGRRRAAAFSWRRTAAETAGVYARLLRRA